MVRQRVEELPRGVTMISSIRLRSGEPPIGGTTLFGWGSDEYTQPAEISSGWTFAPKSTLGMAGIRFDGLIYYATLLSADGVQWSQLAESGGNQWTHVSRGNGYLLAIRSDGKLFSFGYNNYGQLGVGDTTNRLASMAQVTSSNWLTAVASHYHSLAIRSDGALFSWGLNQFGALGNGTATVSNTLVPTRVGTATWSYVDAGAYGTMAIRSDGKLFGWGEEVPGLANTNGVVTQIGADNWSAVSFSKENSHALAIRSDGKLFAWGSGQYGKLGTGNTANQSVPVQVGADNWAFVSAGINFSLGITASGSLFSWGRNNYGQLGLGDKANRTVPTQVGTDTWSAVVAADEYEGFGFKSS